MEKSKKYLEEKILIDEYKQYFRIIAEEVNVKEVSYIIGQSEKGEITINYSLEDDWFNWKLGDTIIYSKRLEAITAEVLKKSLNNME